MYAIYGNIYHILPSIYPQMLAYIPYMDPMGNVSWDLSAMPQITGCVRGVMFTDVAMR